jgi:MSHA biogenesis protein MshQ
MVQYYNGTIWVTHTIDNFTAFNTRLTTAGGNLIATVKSGLASGITVTSPGTSAVASGVRTITLAAPGVGGSVELSLNAPSYLLDPPSFVSNTPARATFGIYKSPLIYRRENY